MALLGGFAACFGKDIAVGRGAAIDREVRATSIDAIDRSDQAESHRESSPIRARRVSNCETGRKPTACCVAKQVGNAPISMWYPDTVRTKIL